LGGGTAGWALKLQYPEINAFQEVVLRMQDPSTGVPVRTVKTFMTKIPSVFTGKPNADVLWLDALRCSEAGFLNMGENR
jgi:hypothetical protein